ncbi:hypothetical protein ACFXPI_27905 [Streptomyces sp. NPDC059104]|uniref:hypothetical protein n=1 Tax=Streptomyces sp. NPDC059104 TaxID=3346729 RepID=UPI003690E8FE
MDVGHGACDGGVAVDVLEGADTVVLTGRVLPGRTTGEPGTVCPMVRLSQTVPVALTRPLGTRVLLDAASGAPLEPVRPLPPLPAVSGATGRL